MTKREPEVWSYEARAVGRDEAAPQFWTRRSVSGGSVTAGVAGKNVPCSLSDSYLNLDILVKL